MSQGNQQTAGKKRLKVTCTDDESTGKFSSFYSKLLLGGNLSGTQMAT